MTDRNVLDPNETPEDVATLYSWANLHGAKYRDFSASRAQTREKARQRVQQAIEEGRRRAIEEAEAQKAASTEEARATVEAERLAEMDAKDKAHKAAQEAPAAEAAAKQPVQGPHVSQGVPNAQSYPAPGQSFYAPQSAAPAYGQPQAPAPANSSALVSLRDEAPLHRAHPWAPSEARETQARPAWLSSDRNDVAPQPVQQAPADTLQGSRDRLTSRWFALKGVFSGGPALSEAVPAPVASRAPVLAVFSLAGGVGKTSLVATLGRALSARGERVLLVDTAAFGLLPFFFGARDQRPGVLRTFTPPGSSADAPIQMLTMDPETLGPETAPQETLTQEILRYGHGVNRILIDLATASGATTRRILRMSPTVLVPVIPDMSSVVSVSSIDSFFQRNTGTSAQPVMPFYVLNQFDPSLPLHLDVREVLREQLGDRLLTFSLRRAPAVSEALAEGMTVVDYAPNSTVAEDFNSLAGWVKSLAAPATSGFRGVRWSER